MPLKKGAGTMLEGAIGPSCRKERIASRRRGAPDVGSATDVFIVVPAVGGPRPRCLLRSPF